MRVMLSALGIERRLQGRAKTIYGDAKTNPLTNKYIMVRRDGQKSWSVYSADFWTRITQNCPTCGQHWTKGDSNAD